MIWAIETEREQDLEYLPLTTLLALAEALELRPGDLFVGHEAPPIPPAADDIIVEAALREHPAGLSRDVLARGLGWPLERVNRALDVLAQRLRHTGSRLRRVSSNGYAIGARRQALTTAQWALLAQLPGTTIDLTPEAATALYQIAFGGRRLRTDTWDEADTGLRLLRTQHLLAGTSQSFTLAPEVVYSLRLDVDEPAEH